jgi:hypothetical protein
MTTQETGKMNWLAATAFTAICLTLASAAVAEKISITVGDQAIPAGPMCFKTIKPLDDMQYYFLAGKEADVVVQVDRDGRVWWWQAKPLQPGKTYTFSLEVAGTGTNPEPGGLSIRVRKSADDQVDVKASGRLFTSLMFKKDEPKVYLYPVIGPTEKEVTRDFPMKDNPVEKENKRQDHPHHRSLWCAHGDIRTGDMSKPGADYWSEHKDTPIDQVAHQVLKKVKLTSGPVFGQIDAEIDWINAAGKKDFTELRTYTFFAGEGLRFIDVKNVFKFDDQDVMFGDTKEGGIVALRTAVTIDEVGIQKPERLHGERFNSEGKTGQACWGEPANWCDYVGPLLGDKTVGIAIMDFPKNYGHPVHWHIRDYGLYTANPFGLAEFAEGIAKEAKKAPPADVKSGAHTFKKGETAEFNYRILIHKDDLKSANVPEQWKLYSDPPKFTVTEK